MKHPLFAIARTFTPLLNTPNFKEIFGGNDGCSLPFDEQKLVRAVETIALPNTKFCIFSEEKSPILKVKTQDYPAEALYVDRRFVEFVDSDFPERQRCLPTTDEIISHLHSLEGVDYVWGGNWSHGIPEMLAYYPPKMSLEKMDPLVQTHWMLKGVDCSGLLYQVTSGYTPRNTGQLLEFGIPVCIEGKNPHQIKNVLKPLDLIVWKGHVILVLNQDTTIESRAGKGVIKKDTLTCLEELLSEKKPVDDWESTTELGPRFVLRRWRSIS